MSKFDRANFVDQLVWQMREADLPRGENRAIVQRLFNGDPPWTEKEAEENQVQVNRNDLQGVNLMTQGRRQWQRAMLKTGNFVTISFDSGPRHKRTQWGHTVTQGWNRELKRSRVYIDSQRSVGANLLLHGPGPSNWRNRRDVVARALPVASVMIPSETLIDFENLPYVAFFQEMTPAMLYTLTSGPKRDPGWNMPLVGAQLNYTSEQVMKQPNATAFQYMPERIEELAKQDLGMWSSDAVPTVDFWDFYFREKNDGPIYRRVILDWGLASQELTTYKGHGPPKRKNDAAQKIMDNEKDEYGGFLYTSGKRKFADNWNQVFHCQFGDCSPYGPMPYHSVRGLGWMVWGVCDLENRMHCKFAEAAFQQLMWFFRVASNEQFTRLKMAEFQHMGVIPVGVDWLKQADRFTPDKGFIELAFARFKQLMAENSAAFVSDFDKGGSGKEMREAEVMARLHATNSLVSSMIDLAYTYEEFKDCEMLRRGCLPGNPDHIAMRFQDYCIKEGVPREMLDVNRMTVTRERTIGGGNKALEMAQVSFLQGLRKNLPPAGQRKVDHIAIEAATEDAHLAEELAPTDEEKYVTHSTHDAQLSTDRLMRNLPFSERPDMIYEDYVRVWLIDLALMIKNVQQSSNVGGPDQLAGFANMLQHIEKFLGFIEGDPEEREKVRQYRDQAAQLGNAVKGFAQRLAQAMQAGNGQKPGGGIDPKDAAKVQGTIILAKTKAQLATESHAQRTAQRQIAFDLEQQRREREHNADLRRSGQEHALDFAADRFKAFQE